MPDLQFEIISSHVKQYAAIPTLAFGLQITNNVVNQQVYAAALKCQIMIEAVRRRYDEDDKDRLFELFGRHTRWDETLRTVFWQIITVPVPSFVGRTVIEITVPCQEDLATSSGKYFYAVRNGSVPLDFLFSGTLFYENEDRELQVTLIPWEKEARFQMPSALWQEAMEMHFPDTKWLSIRRSLFDQLVKYKGTTKFATLQNCLEDLLQDKLPEEPVEKLL